MNRSFVPLQSIPIMGSKAITLKSLLPHVPLSVTPSCLLFPKQSGDLYMGWMRVYLPFDKQKTPLTLVVTRDPRNKEPVVCLTNRSIHTPLDALETFGYYLERWGKEEGYRFSKSFFNLEDLRVLKWPAIRNLSLLVHFTCLFIALTYRDNAWLMQRISEQKLKNFKHVSTIRYKYYRIAQLMQVLLCEQRTLNSGMMAMTQVG